MTRRTRAAIGLLQMVTSLALLLVLGWRSVRLGNGDSSFLEYVLATVAFVSLSKSIHDRYPPPRD